MPGFADGFFGAVSNRLPSAPGWRMIYNPDKSRVEVQTDKFGTGFWFPVGGWGLYHIHDDFHGVLTSVAGKVVSSAGWDVTVAVGGTVAPVSDHGGGLLFTIDGNNAEAAIHFGEIYPFKLLGEPHLEFEGHLDTLAAAKLAELGLEDATEDHHVLIYYDGTAGEIRWSVDNGTGAPTTGLITGSPDMLDHVYQMRFGDDGTNGPGSKCEIAVDGVIVATLTKAATAKYPLTNTLMTIACHASSAGAAAFSYTLHHVNVVADKV